jgi:hypothetical protein
MSDDLTTSHEDPRLRIGRIWVDPRAAIYATIIMITALTVFNEATGEMTWDLFKRVTAVLVAPLFALAMAHAFSEALDLQIRFHRRLNKHDRRHVLIVNMQYLYPCIAPVIFTLIAAIFGWDAGVTTWVILIALFLSLFWWGFYAGRRAQLPLGRQLIFGLGYSLLGLIVLVVEMWMTH